jgi:hypothetical protein
MYRACRLLLLHTKSDCHQFQSPIWLAHDSMALDLEESKNMLDEYWFDMSTMTLQ